MTKGCLKDPIPENKLRLVNFYGVAKRRLGLKILADNYQSQKEVISKNG